MQIQMSRVGCPFIHLLLYRFSSVPLAVALVRKLVAVLESIDKLPVYTYDSPGAGYGLQVRYTIEF